MTNKLNVSYNSLIRFRGENDRLNNLFFSFCFVNEDLVWKFLINDGNKMDVVSLILIVSMGS